MKKDILPNGYTDWLESVKSKIRSAQLKAAVQVNTELIALYWDLGRQITEKQETEGWGNAVVERLAADLRQAFPGSSGYSRSNLFYMRQFYRFYREAPEFVQQAAGQIPWWHNVLIFSKSKNMVEAEFYLKSTLEHNWARSVLTIQMETNLHQRQGKSVTNFSKTLPKPQSDLAQQTLKDPQHVVIDATKEFARLEGHVKGIGDFVALIKKQGKFSACFFGSPFQKLRFFR